jgi:hypothetical protein
MHTTHLFNTPSDTLTSPYPTNSPSVRQCLLSLAYDRVLCMYECHMCVTDYTLELLVLLEQSQLYQTKKFNPRCQWTNSILKVLPNALACLNVTDT